MITEHESERLLRAFEEIGKQWRIQNQIRFLEHLSRNNWPNRELSHQVERELFNEQR